MHNIGESEMKKKVELHRRIQAYLSYLYLSTTIIARFFFPRVGPKGTEQRRSQVTQSFISMKVDLRQ